MAKKSVQLFDLNRIINRPPGTLVYQGAQSDPFGIEVISFNSQVYEVLKFPAAEEFEAYIKVHKNKGSVLWVNITGINHVEDVNIVGKILGIEAFILEQVVSKSKHSMFKITDDFIFNDLQMIYNSGDEILNDNFSIYVNNQFVVTFQEKVGDIFDSVRDRIINDTGKIRKSDKGYTYFCLLDDLIDNYLDTLERLRFNIEIMEETITNLEVLNVSEIHEARKNLMIIKFSATPVSKMIQQLIQTEYLGNTNTIFLESLSNHIREVESELAIQKETVDGLYQNYVLNNSNDMNSIMTTLTIFSAIFIPLSFLTGVFGMNFDIMPGLSNSFAFYYFIGGCVLTSVIMILVFKVKKWF